MKDKLDTSERGQVLILIALGLVVLLGFTALAIDGSMMYSDRRYGQNAADASSLAGGGTLSTYWVVNEETGGGITNKNFSCDIGSTTINMVEWYAIPDAIQRAADNGFTIEYIYPENVTPDSANYVTYACTNDGSTQFVDVIVELEFETNTSFVHFVYDGPVRQRVRSITHVRPYRFLAFGNAIVGLNPCECSGQSTGVSLHGGESTLVYGGGVWSNGCMRVDGTAGVVHIPDSCVSYYTCPPGSLPNASCPTVYNIDTSCIQQNPGELIDPEDYAIDPPDCTPRADVYNYTITKKKDAEELLFAAPLNPGLYCITGDVSLVNNTDRLIGDRVTLYFKGGDLTATGGLVQLSAVPFYEQNYNGPALPGVVIYNDGTVPEGCLPPCPPVGCSGSCIIKLPGNSENVIDGLIYAPGCEVTMLGNTETGAAHAQIIGWNVEVGGQASTLVIFDEAYAVSWPNYIDLWR